MCFVFSFTLPVCRFIHIYFFFISFILLQPFKCFVLIFFIKQHKCTHNGYWKSRTKNLYHWENFECCSIGRFTAKDSFSLNEAIYICSVRRKDIGFDCCCCYLVCTGCRTRFANDKLYITIPADTNSHIEIHRIRSVFFSFFQTKKNTFFWWNALIRDKSSKKSFTFSFCCIGVFILFSLALRFFEMTSFFFFFFLNVDLCSSDYSKIRNEQNHIIHVKLYKSRHKS